MENTENQEETQTTGLEKPNVFNPSLDKFTNVKTTEELLKAVEVINNAIPLKVRYIRVNGKSETVVEHSIWNDDELQFLKGKLIHLVNHIQ
jgi:alkylated DNA repair dioxygenase AlkB